ncbi:MAG: PAS domain S-box protein [Bacteroidales bacterium]
MELSDYKIFHSLALGFALHEIICDDQGEPTDYLFLDINEAFTRMTGLSPDFVIGKTVKQILPGVEDYWIKRYGKVALTGQPDSFENFSGDLGKKYRVSAFCPEKGYFGVLFDDVTPIEKLSKKLLDAENKYQRFFSLSNDGIIIINREGLIHDSNDRFSEFVGISRPRLIGSSLLDLCARDRKENLRQVLSTLFEEGSLREEVALIDANGNTLILELLANVYDARSELALCNLRNITERKQLEEEKEEYHQRVEAIFKQDALGIAYLTPTMYIENCNEKFCKILGYPADMLLGKPFDTLLHPEDRAFYHPTLALLSETGQNHTMVNRLINQKGEVIYVKRVVSAVMDKAGKPAHYIAFLEDITSQKQAEEALNVHQQLHTRILNDITELLVRWKPDGTIVFSNKAYKEYYKQTHNDEEIKNNLFENITGEAIQRLKSHVAQLTPKTPVVLEKHETFGKDGSRWHLWTDRGIFDKAGNLIEIQSIGLDITELEKASTEAKTQQTFFEELFNNSPYALVFLDLNNRVLRINKAFTQIFGYTPEEAVGKAINELVVPEGMQGEWAKFIGKIIKDEEVFLETLLKRKDGSLFEARLTGRPVNLGGKFLGIFGIYEDITQQKQNQRHLQRHAQLIELILSITQSPSMDYRKMLTQTVKEATRLMEADFGVIFEYKPHVKEAIIHAYTNSFESECSLLNRLTVILEEPGNLILQSLSTNHPIILQDQKKDEAAILEQMCPGKEVRSMMLIPVSYEGHLGAALVLGSHNKNHFASDNLSEGTLLMDAVWRAVEQQRLVQELRRALQKAEESEKLKSSFLATMSHELRTPLNAIIGFSSLIDESMPIEDIMDSVRTIQASGNHLLNLINDMFHLSALEAGHSSVATETISVSRLMSEIHDFINSYQQVENKQNLQIIYRPDPSAEEMKMVTDTQKLNDILINLIKNAIKFTDEGFVEYGYQVSNETITFFVKDSGVGIPEDKYEVIFEKFRQGDDSSTRRHGGTGIGLTLVKGLTELLGGIVYFESTVGKGSTFYVEFPIQLKPEDLKEKSQDTINLKDYTLVVVEDEMTNYQLIESILKKYQPKLIHFTEGESAVSYVASGQPADLVLMDIRLPGIDGLEATRQIRKLRPDLPIIAQTAYAMVGDRERTLAAGCTDYISKPFRRQQMIDIIWHTLQKGS